MGEFDYYQRQTLLSEIGKRGQEKFKQTSALVVGAGGLGHPAACYLAAAGIGKISIVDFDCVEMSNLNRQVLFSPSDVGKPKAKILADRIKNQNPFIEIVAINQRVTFDNIKNLLQTVDVVVDCSDNFSTKFLLHDFCFLMKKDLVQGSIYKYGGQLQVFPFKRFFNSSSREDVICLRCLWPEMPKDDCFLSCAEVGVVGAVVGAIGSMQAMEVVKLVAGLGNGGHASHFGRTVTLNFLDNEVHSIRWKKNPSCSLCSTDLAKRVDLKKDMYAFEEEVKSNKNSREVKSMKDYELVGLEQKNLALVDLRRDDEIENPITKEMLSPYDVQHLPFTEFEDWRDGIDATSQYLFICSKGIRSGKVTEWLRKNKREHKNNFFSLYGGLDFYSDR